MKRSLLPLVAALMLVASAICTAHPVPPTIAKQLEFVDFTDGNKFMYFYDEFDPPEAGWVFTDSSGAGQYWHLTDRPCLTWWSPPNSYVCSNDPDTSSLPGGLDCRLVSPLIDLSGIHDCTVWYAANMHFDYDANTGIFQGSTTCGSYGASYITYVTVDDGEHWHNLGEYAGDMERHFEPYSGRDICSVAGYFRIGGNGEIDDLLQQTGGGAFRFAFAVKTDPAGAFGCVASGNCWLAIERVFVTTHFTAEDQPAEWGSIKSMFE